MHTYRSHSHTEKNAHKLKSHMQPQTPPFKIVHKTEREHIYYYRIHTSVFIPNTIVLKYTLTRSFARSVSLAAKTFLMFENTTTSILVVVLQITIHCSIHVENACNLLFHFKFVQLFMRINYLYILN